MSMKAIFKSKSILIPRSLSTLRSIQTKRTRKRKFYPNSEFANKCKWAVATITESKWSHNCERVLREHALGSIQIKRTRNRKFYPYSEIAYKYKGVTISPEGRLDVSIVLFERQLYRL